MGHEGVELWGNLEVLSIFNRPVFSKLAKVVVVQDARDDGLADNSMALVRASTSSEVVKVIHFSDSLEQSETSDIMVNLSIAQTGLCFS